MIGEYSKAIEIAKAQLSKTNPRDRIAQAATNLVHPPKYQIEKLSDDLSHSLTLLDQLD